MEAATSSVASAESYTDQREYVLRVLRRRCRWLAADELEAVFHDAYALMLEKARDGALELAVMHPRQVQAYLTQTAINKALDEGKRAERKRSEPLGDAPLAEPDTSPALDELVATSMDSARIREIVAELPERRQAIIKLRFFFDRTPEEIQGYLGITERAYRRDLERALRHLSERYALVRDGAFCQERKSVVLAYVVGIAGPGRAQVARDHLATCPRCAHWAAELREATRRAAVLLPVPFPVLRPDHVERFVHSAGALRDQLVELGVATKRHAFAAVTRVDHSAGGYAGTVRPGTVVGVVAGCVAIGGGAAGYCAVQGVPDPIGHILRIDPVKPAPSRRENVRAVAPPSPPPVAVTPAPDPVPQAEPPPAPIEPPAPAPPPVEQEFGVQDQAGAASPARQPASPQPSGASEEFDP